MQDTDVHALLNRMGMPNAVLHAPIPSVVSPIHRAVENTCRIAQQPSGRTVFIKTLQGDMTGFVDFAASAEATRKAGEAGISPRLLLDDAGSRTLVLEALDENWRWGRIDDLRAPDRFASLVTAKRRFHSVPALLPRPSLFEVLEQYKALIPDESLPSTANEAFKKVGRICRALQASGIDAVPCHADGASSNVMVGPASAVQLVDFEWARQSDPAHDLGAILAELFPLEAEALLAVEIWVGRPDGQLLARARLYGVLDDMMWALWGFICAKSSTRSHIEFTKYAEWRLLRARTVLEHPRFETWLSRA